MAAFPPGWWQGPRHNPAFPPKYIGRNGGIVPQRPPGRADGETSGEHAARLYAMGYTLADVRTLADLPDWEPAS
jgi:hypothetical protein